MLAKTERRISFTGDCHEERLMIYIKEVKAFLLLTRFTSSAAGKRYSQMHFRIKPLNKKNHLKFNYLRQIAL